MAELVLEFDTHPGRTLTLALFKDFSNAKELRANMADGPDVALMNAAVVVDTFAVQLAAHRALAAETSGRMTTKTLHAELIYGMSGTKHVAESFKRNGINDDSTALLLARFDCKPEEWSALRLACVKELETLKSRVRGTQVPLAELASLTDTGLIDKYYKITKEELKVRSRSDAVAFRIGTKDCA
ncbi:hypothetical protein GPECTOR_74g686 [Gonium pectorale]|uniref:EKC/KEOPS complex subunit CGI121 n=1 Tax=Gonium pectorale TaxID=33097 RepID=A0A150G2H4_GONPE|nr:hypothetical protein GPECTOR_74g686 [Gonium pectorale]|eukprot:KXZ44072.1 hypothetical protein GPECTOR_74g686 [Gonium pectorale]